MGPVGIGTPTGIQTGRIGAGQVAEATGRSRIALRGIKEKGQESTKEGTKESTRQRVRTRRVRVDLPANLPKWHLGRRSTPSTRKKRRPTALLKSPAK